MYSFPLCNYRRRQDDEVRHDHYLRRRASSRSRSPPRRSVPSSSSTSPVASDVAQEAAVPMNAPIATLDDALRRMVESSQSIPHAEQSTFPRERGRAALLSSSWVTGDRADHLRSELLLANAALARLHRAQSEFYAVENSYLFQRHMYWRDYDASIWQMTEELCASSQAARKSPEASHGRSKERKA